MQFFFTSHKLPSQWDVNRSHKESWTQCMVAATLGLMRGSSHHLTPHSPWGALYRRHRLMEVVLSPADYISLDLWPLTKRNGTDICLTASKIVLPYWCRRWFNSLPAFLSPLLGCPQTPPSKGEVSHGHSDVLFVCMEPMLWSVSHTEKVDLHYVMCIIMVMSIDGYLQSHAVLAIKVLVTHFSYKCNLILPFMWDCCQTLGVCIMCTCVW